MGKYWKRRVVIGLESILLLEIVSIDAMPLRFVSYAKENEKIFSDVGENDVNGIYTGDEIILSGERKGDFEVDENGVLIKYYGDGGDVAIPEGVTEIGNSAFMNNECTGSLDGLVSVTIPERVTTIEGFAFYGCSGLTSITIPEGVTKIGECAFCKCSKLINVTIPEGITKISNSTFAYCRNLTSVTIPKGVTTIERWAFAGCRNLTSVTIPREVTEIGNAAFANGNSWDDVTIIESLTIYCYVDSYAETYAKENNIPYQLLDTVENSDITTTDITNTEEESNNPDSSQDSQENHVTEYIFYTVERGDNLWRISQKYYGTGRYWEEIFRNNLDTIKDANRIYSRQVIKIPQK